MARTTKRYTPAQFAAVLVEISKRLGNIKPVMKKQAKRYQAHMRKNVRQSRNADGSPMAPLSGLTLRGNITNRDGSAGPLRRNYGAKPLLATGEMVRQFKAIADDRGWIAHVTDDFKRKVSFWQGNVPTGRTLKIRPSRDPSGVAMAAAMARKGMPISRKTAAAGFTRPARLPFALDSRRVKRSVTELNKFVLKPLFG